MPQVMPVLKKRKFYPGVLGSYGSEGLPAQSGERATRPGAHTCQGAHELKRS